MNLSELTAIMPKAPLLRLAGYLPFLNEALAEFEINTPDRIAAFLAQLAHESGELRYMEELADGKAYEGRKDLGNTEKGDGPRFKGRGPIQLTGRANYRKFGERLGLPLETEPERAANPDVGFRIAGCYWKVHGLNTLADAGPLAFDAITKRINGGQNGKVDRWKYYDRARKVFGL